MSDVQVAEATEVTFAYDGDDYTIKSNALGRLDVAEPWEDGKYVTAARELLGRDQWSAFKNKDRTYSDVLVLFGNALEAINKVNEDD